MKNLFTILLIIMFYGNVLGQKNPKKIKSHKIITKDRQMFTIDSVPLNGFYKIKYTDDSSDWKKEISHFNNGFRTGTSKILRFNKLEEQGTYVKGRKHGTWKEYFYTTGDLTLTTEYKNGIKHGVESGQHVSAGVEFICNYVNGSIEGPLLRYDYTGYLESKEFYKNGKIRYKHKYDHFLNLVEENIYTYKSNQLFLDVQRNNYNKVSNCDSIFYKKGDTTYRGENIPNKIKKYKNNKLTVHKEISIEKDTTRSGEDDYVLITNSYDNAGKKESVFIYYNTTSIWQTSLNDIKNYILFSNYDFNPCFIYKDLLFQDVITFTFYFKYENEDYFYEAEYDALSKDISSGCYNRKDPLSEFKQSYFDYSF